MTARLTALVFLAACVRDAPLPDVGDCADYPDGVYEYGQIGIGTCLAGPTELHFTESADGEPLLLVTNANPYQVFNGGSLLSIPWDRLDTSRGRNLISDLVEPTAAHDLPSFGAGYAQHEDLGLVTVRLSEGSRVRQTFDEVFLLDMEDPAAPAPSSRGTAGSDAVLVQSDPVDVVVDPASGYAFVANRTSHTISVLDASGQTVEVVQPWPEGVLSSASFEDRDRSGSKARMASLRVTVRDLLPDDAWTLTWIEGTWSLWLPEADTDATTSGLVRYDTAGLGYTENALGTELNVNESLTVSEVRDPSLVGTAGRMVFVSDGSIRAASSDAFLGDWNLEPSALYSPPADAWDADPGGPAMVLADDGQLWLFYDGGGTDGTASPGIGVVTSADGLNFAPLDEVPVLEPGDNHDSVAIADPYVLFDNESDLWRMFYSAWDGVRWTIGHATSEDLVTWTADAVPVFAIDGMDVAAPVVSREAGRWQLWFSQRDATEWTLGHAESSDGSHWRDAGRIEDLSEWAWSSEEPPGVALLSAPNGSFRVEGENWGLVDNTAFPGSTFFAADYGWRALMVTDHQLGDGDVGSASNGGVRVDSVLLDSTDPPSGLAWLTVTSSGGVERIAAASVEEDYSLTPVDGPLAGAIFEGTTGFDRDGAASPVVYFDGTIHHLFYAGRRGRKTAVGHATSPDGLSWTRQGSVLAPGNEGTFDALVVEPGSIQPLEDGSIRLWYSAFDGEIWRIGSAIAEVPGAPFERETGPVRPYQLGTGEPGDWDDSGARHPWVVETEDGTQLWYAGFDGTTWRLGSALRPADTGAFVRSEDANEDPRAVLDPANGRFESEGLGRPVLVADPQGDGWWGWYEGTAGGEPRVGGLYGLAADRLNRITSPPTAGDVFTFTTEKGDEDVEAIPLDTSLPDADILGVGLSALTLDEERGFLYATSKLAPFIIVLDIRDDSDDAFLDSNYLDVEAVLLFNTAGGGDGFRQVLPVPGTDLLYGVNDSPEAVWMSDISALEDTARADVFYETVVGWLPAPRGRERDKGADSQMSIGPGQLVLHPDGRRLFVSNFNANSVSVYDLGLGAVGLEIAEITLLGENPYAMALSPDGTQLVVGNYTGETVPNGLAESSLVVVDVDEASSTYLEPLTWVVNR